MDETIKFPDEAKRLRMLLLLDGPQTQKAFAEKFGTGNKKTFGAYFIGRNRIPVEIALKVADHYGVSLDWIYGGRKRTVFGGVRDRLEEIERQEGDKIA